MCKDYLHLRSTTTKAGTLPNCLSLDKKSDVSNIKDLVHLISGVIIQSKYIAIGDKTESVDATIGQPGGLLNCLWIFDNI